MIAMNRTNTTSGKPGRPGIVNLTHHAIRIIDRNGKLITVIPPSGVIARLTEKIVGHETSGDVPISDVVLHMDDSALPPPKPGTLYIVPLAVAVAAARSTGRKDLVVPADIVREPETNRIVGAMCLKRVTDVIIGHSVNSNRDGNQEGEQ